MPLYLCASPHRSLSRDTKCRISQAITEVHCDVTGAPPEFVHVFFFEQEGLHALKQLASAAASGASYLLFGNIRSGRTDATKDRLVEGMRQRAAELLTVDVDEVQMITRDINASWVMEGGDLLPEPGEEEAWLAKHRQKMSAVDG